MLHEEGLEKTIRYLSSENFSSEKKASLAEEKIILGGYPCISGLLLLN